MRSLFHFAFNVTDLDQARRFYGDVLGCTEGRSTATWVDFDFMGHQLSLHLGPPFKTERTGHVGDTLVPMPHFGLVLALPDWQAMAARLQAAGTDFLFAPQVRFEASRASSGPCFSATRLATRWRSRVSATWTRFTRHEDGPVSTPARSELAQELVSHARAAGPALTGRRRSAPLPVQGAASCRRLAVSERGG